MTTNLKPLAIVAAAMMALSAQANAEAASQDFAYSDLVVLAQAAPGNGNGGIGVGGGVGAAAGGGIYGFGSAYHNSEFDGTNCEHLRKRAQWSGAFYWWRKYNKCTAQQN